MKTLNTKELLHTRRTLILLMHELTTTNKNVEHIEETLNTINEVCYSLLSKVEI